MVDNWTPDIECLIAAAGQRPEKLREVIAGLGVARAVALALTEWQLRLDPPANEQEVRIGVRVVDGMESVEHTWLLGAGTAGRFEAGLRDDCDVRLTYQLEDLIGDLWGPDRGRRAGTHAYELATGMDLNFPPRERQPAIAAASHTLLAAVSARPPDLGALAVAYGSDKWGQVHWFTPHYERHFAALRDQPVRVLEIGVGGYDSVSGGGSLKMWRRYFRRGVIFGLDCFDKSHLSGPRLEIVQGDQNDPAQLARIGKEHGPFDIVIDDGSHVNEHVLTSFHALWPFVRSGGWYVIEDLWTSYLPGYGGDAADLNRSDTMLGLLKGLIDDLHHEERDRTPGLDPSGTEAGLVGMHIYHNLAFLEKGVNAEGGIPRWMPRAPHW